RSHRHTSWAAESSSEKVGASVGASESDCTSSPYFGRGSCAYLKTKRPAKCGAGRSFAEAISVDRQIGLQRGVFAGVADTDHEFAWVDGPFVRRFVPVAEGAGIERQRDVLAFAWSEVDLL